MRRPGHDRLEHHELGAIGSIRPIPVVSKYKWLEPRHMVNVCERWAKDRTDELQAAFFNGVGYESWENVWGIWNQTHAARRRGPPPHRHHRAGHGRLAGQSRLGTARADVAAEGVYASRFPAKDRTFGSGQPQSNKDVDGEQLAVPHAEGVRYYDLWNGAKLKPTIAGQDRQAGFPDRGPRLRRGPRRAGGANCRRT